MPFAEILTSACMFQIRRSREPHQKDCWHRSRRNWRGLRRRRVVSHRPRRRLKGSSRLSVNLILNFGASPFFEFSTQTSSRQSLMTTPSSGQTRTWPSSPTGTSFVFSGMVNLKPAFLMYVLLVKNCGHSLYFDIRIFLDSYIYISLLSLIYVCKEQQIYTYSDIP